MATKKQSKQSKKENKPKSRSKNPEKYQNLPLSKEQIEDLEKGAAEAYDSGMKEEIQEDKEEEDQQFKNIIDDQKGFLDLFNAERYKFGVVFEGNLINMELKPVGPGDNLSFLDIDYDPYSELSEEQMKIVNKVSKNKKLSNEEEGMLKLIKRRINKTAKKVTEQETTRLAVEILARYVISPNLGKTLPARRAVWQNVIPSFRNQLAEIVSRKLGINKDASVQLFRAD